MTTPRDETPAMIREYLAVQHVGTILTAGMLERKFSGVTGYAIKQLLTEETKRGTLRVLPRRGYEVVRHDAAAIIRAMLFVRVTLAAALLELIVDQDRDASALVDFQLDLETNAKALHDAIRAGIKYDIDMAALNFVRADMDMHRAVCDIAGYAPLARVIDYVRDEMQPYLLKDAKQPKRINEIVEEHRAWSQPLIAKNEPAAIRKTKAILAYQIHLDQAVKDATSRLGQAN